MKNYLLVGGTRDGEFYQTEMSRPPLHIYMARRISLEEDRKLRINDQIAYRAPDDVYKLDVDGKYYFEKTVSYFPGDYK